MLVLIVLAAEGCDRDKSEPFSVASDEPATPVERSDARPDWCAAHAVPESQCTMCLARRAAPLEVIGTCGATTSSCAVPDGLDTDPVDATPRGARTER